MKTTETVPNNYRNCIYPNYRNCTREAVITTETVQGKKRANPRYYWARAKLSESNALIQKLYTLSNYHR